MQIVENEMGDVTRGDILSRFRLEIGADSVFIDIEGHPIGCPGMDSHGTVLDAIEKEAGWEYKDLGGEQRFAIQDRAKLIYKAVTADRDVYFVATTNIGTLDQAVKAVTKNLVDTNEAGAILEYGDKQIEVLNPTFEEN